jgi:hypothetical protein
MRFSLAVCYYQQNMWVPFRGQSINGPRVLLYSSVQCASPGYQCCGSGSGGSVINWPPGSVSGGSVINWLPASGSLFFYQRNNKNVHLRSVHNRSPGSGSVNQVDGSADPNPKEIFTYPQHYLIPLTEWLILVTNRRSGLDWKFSI